MPSKESLTANITACFEGLEEALREQGDAARIAGEAMNVIPATDWHIARYDPESRRIIFRNTDGEDVETSEEEVARWGDVVSDLEPVEVIVDESHCLDGMMIEWTPGAENPNASPIWGRTPNGDWELGATEKPKKEPEINITISEKLNLIGAEDVESE